MLSRNPDEPPFLAAKCLAAGIRRLSEPQLRPFLLLPLLINLIIYSGALVIGYYFLTTWIHQIIPAWLNWLEWLLWPLFLIGFGMIGFFSFSLLANLLAAPFYNRLAAKTLELVTGVAVSTVEENVLNITLAECRRISYLMARLAPLSLLFLIPVTYPIAPVLWALFSAWGMALEYFAYPLEQRGLLFPQQKDFLQRHRWDILSFGCLVGLGSALPSIC
jgi:CysZ protein